ncbi:Gfo/Idh/MocA family protein [Cytobacillus sp. Hz8]|uniref:Gfo/Idh/MocA family protein n=1 Tax=Cytobacillus sp. Hz8 TaxID=3347168 RepID=UPI0035E335BA
MIRFGIIGTNWITEKFIDAASKIEDFQLAAVYSRTKEKAKEFAEKFGASTTFTNLEEMAGSDEIDAVYIASPNSFHSLQAILFLQNKKHVICEKPICSNQKELSAMIQAAEENQVLLMEAVKSTFMPGFKAVQDHLHKIGDVRRYFASYCQYSSRYDAYKEGTILNAFDPKFSNGSLMDIGIYCIYPLVALFGKPQEIKASGLLLDSGIDGQGSILLKYEDKDAVIMYSKISDSFLPSEIQGEKGSMIIDRISAPEKAEIRYRSGEVETLVNETIENSMYYEAKEFIELIQNGEVESRVNTFANSMIVMEIMDEVRKQVGVVFPADQQ